MALLFDEKIVFYYKNEFIDNDEVLKEKLSLADSFKEEKNLSDLYIIISDTKTNKDKGEMYFSVKVFLDSNKNVLLYSENHNCNIDISNENTPNFYVQGYNYLKTLDKYKDSKDC